ncbi:hypothetical protein BDP81DRAFT_437705 [Colletotrichum phormii]|uniref:Uncharacterized protein n=1 Tax=Colletotrichum phormii TaxID=359342 RepID=A0AAJ0ECA2_9PEZI|nr:uncharacterized protein BDP81DRAFT_437705 [Colletotrichum phormii]KAK1624498.1 hypothetical protein BDP81DRAFT_437705 [Colletotrichum phormii]
MIALIGRCSFLRVCYLVQLLYWYVRFAIELYYDATTAESSCFCGWRLPSKPSL